jgi:putative Holliday junction resolvase
MRVGVEFNKLDKPEVAIASNALTPDSAGRLLALDLGAKRVGVAVSDELRITANPLPAIERRSWKDLLSRVASIIEAFDACGLVIGLPLSLEGPEGSAARDARATAQKFQRSLSIPVYLQDERLTTLTATAQLKEAGRSPREIKGQIDSESAAVILGDFIAQTEYVKSLNRRQKIK